MGFSDGDVAGLSPLAVRHRRRNRVVAVVAIVAFAATLIVPLLAMVTFEPLAPGPAVTVTVVGR